jgi:rod shape-determining protein MreD
MRIQYLIPVLVFIPVLIIQITVIPLISIESIAPDLLLIALVYFTISLGQIPGTLYGAFLGLAFDLITGSLLGSTMLSYTVAGFTAGYFSSETRREKYLNTFSFTLVVFLCAIAESIIYSFFSILDFNTNIVKLFFDNALLPAVFTGLISIIVLIFPFKKGITLED